MALVGKDFVFVHIYKTGGTSMRALLSGEEVSDYHAPAINTFNDLGKAEWDKRFSFSVVRDPYEFVISQYTHYTRDKGHNYAYLAKNTDLLGFLKRLKKDFKKDQHNGYHFLDTQSSMLCEDGNVLVTKVYKFEEIVKAMKDVSERLDLPFRPYDLNKSDRDGIVHTPETREIVEELYADDFKLFNYPLWTD